MDGLQHYSVADVSGATARDATGPRRFNPVGTCIHHTDGVDSLARLTGHRNPGEEPVSCDILITKSGGRYICTPNGRYAYGVGVVDSAIQQISVRANANELLLSAELEYRLHEAPTWQQYDSLAEQITIWALRWSWRWPYVIYGHYGIASPPGRKIDPYLFDWGTLMGRLLVWSESANIGGLAA